MAWPEKGIYAAIEQAIYIFLKSARRFQEFTEGIRAFVERRECRCQAK